MIHDGRITDGSGVTHRSVVAGNVYDKYGTRNPIARRLVRGFLATVGDLFDARPGERVLEVGAGEGHLLGRLVAGRSVALVAGCDLSPSICSEAARAYPAVAFSAQSAYALAFGDRTFDVVLACEVIEHLDRPEEGLREIARVARRRVVLSVPREPLWRGLNLVRGAYLSNLGNTPGHVQHFSRRAFVALVERHLRVIDVRSPSPWTVVAAAPR